MSGSKLNCWEMMECGREPGGANAVHHGSCTAAAAKACDGVNEGVHGGRVCWAVAGTLCGGHVQGTFAEKRATCLSCQVFHSVKFEQGAEFQIGYA